MERFEVAIVGAGPVGLTLANLLGVLGVHTLVVERNETTVQEPRAVSIDDESLRTMQAAGVVETVQAAVVAGYGSHYYTPGGVCFAKVEPTGRPYGYPKRNAFRQPVLEAQLRAALGRFPHVRALFGWTLDGHEAADGVTLRISRAGETRTVEAAFLVGCDGAASSVREAQGVQLEGTTFDERWLIVDLENHETATKHTKVFCDRRRPCITLPGPDRTRRYEFKLLPGETDADLLAPAMVERLLRTHGGDPGARIVRKVVYRFHARVAPRWRFGPVLLAGDAAHLTPPFAGQGMNSGVRDAHNLAWKLHAVLRGLAGPGLLDSYEAERRDHVWQMIALALRMGRVMSPPSWLEGLLTQTGLLALKLVPQASTYVAQMKFKPPPRFHQGFLLPDGRGRQSLVGRLLPQPRVRTPDGTEMLLDEALGAGFTLLLRSADPARDAARLRQPVWDKLGACLVVLGPGALEPLEAIPLAEGEAVLLRPDHYVAATVPLGSADRVARTVEELLARTWRAPPAQSDTGTEVAQRPEPAHGA